MDWSPPGSSVRGDSPGKNTGEGCHALLQWIFPTQGLNPLLSHYRWILYCLSYWGSPWIHLKCYFISCIGKSSSSVNVQFSSVTQSCPNSATPWIAAHQASLSITNSQSLPKLMFLKSVMPYNHLIICPPLLPLPSIFPSIRVFSNESILPIRWPKYWSLSFSIYPSDEYSGLISFRMDWLDLLAVQGTLKSLLQHHSSKASILSHSAFFMTQCECKLV